MFGGHLYRDDQWARVRLIGPGLILALSLFLPVFAFAAETPTVYFAGVAYTSNASTIAKSFPNASRLLDPQGIASLNQTIRSTLQNVQLPEIISFDSLGSVSDASKSTALALGLDDETTSIDHIGSAYKLRVEISGQALFFDFNEKQVLGGFPFILDYITVLTNQPTSSDIDAAFRKLIFGTGQQHSLVGAFVNTLRHASIPNASAKRLRVTSVTFGSEATAYLAQNGQQVDIHALPKRIAEAFGTYLGATQNLAILPYASDQATGSAMAARFVEGSVFDLKIPPPDYAIRLNIAGFKQLVASRSNVATVYLYGAFVDVTVLEPLSNRIYFSQRIKQGKTKTVPAVQTTLNTWPPTYDTLKSLFYNFTDSLTDPSNPWLKSGLPRDASARSQFSSLQELIKSCH